MSSDEDKISYTNQFYLKLRGTVCTNYFLNLPLHRLPISQKAIITKSISALPRLAWQPESSCESRRVTRVKEREAGYTLPRFFIEYVAGFVR
jgi:hypothetical protein